MQKRDFPQFTLIGLLIGWLVACAEPTVSNHSFSLPSVDRTETLEVVTWNLRYFPEHGNNEVARVRMILDSLDADIVCVQEIYTMSQFEKLARQLPRYNLIKSVQTDYLMLGILYKPALLIPRDTLELFTNDGYAFAGRYPLMVRFTADTDSGSYDFAILDIHLKAMSGNENIQRREAATTLIHDYLLDQIAAGPDSNFIVVGDWNDDLSTDSGALSFSAFLTDTVNFKYTTRDLAWASSNINDSYPGWPSFLDNVLISKALFDENLTATTQTLRLDAYMSDYISLVSDHRPVLYRFAPKPN